MRAHATTQHIEKGLATWDTKFANDQADTAADKGSGEAQKALAVLARVYEAKHKQYWADQCRHKSKIAKTGASGAQNLDPGPCVRQP